MRLVIFFILISFYANAQCKLSCADLSNKCGFIQIELDGDSTNELQTISLLGTDLTLDLGGGTVDLSPLLDDTNAWFTEGTTTKHDGVTGNIYHDGNVGIGIDDVLARLHLSGDVFRHDFAASGGLSGDNSAYIHSSNDGTGNFHKYWNSLGTTSPTRLDAGYALNEEYTASDPWYIIRSADNDVAGSAIAWQDIHRLNMSTGQHRFDQYGLGTFDTGNETFLLGVEADGDIVEVDPNGLGTDDQRLTLSGNTLSIEDGNNVDLSGFVSAPNLDNDPANEIQTLTKTFETIRAICYESRGYNNATEESYNVTVTNNSTGLYTVVFNPSHPQGNNYIVTFGAEEDGNRDVPKVSIVRGSRTSNGFQFYVTEDDNGGGADIPSSSGWQFSVGCEKVVLTDVTISN